MNLLVLFSSLTYLYCLVCGRREDDEEIKKLFCFPKNPEKSKKWQSLLGMVYQGPMSGHKRVCNLHFANEDFIQQTMPLRIYPHATPIPIALIANNPDSDSSNMENMNDTMHTDSNNQHASNKPKVAMISTSTTSKSLGSASTSNVVRGRKSLFKDVHNVCSSNLTREKSLMSIVKKKQGYLRKLQQLCKKRGNIIKNFKNIDKSIELKNIFKGFTATTAQFLISQIRCSKRYPNGRRWTLDDKIMSLAIFKRSPKCYALLRRLFALPSRSTLNLLLQKVPFGVGINKHIFQHIGQCLSKHPEKDRLCTLAFDEMAIREHIEYNASDDCIQGVEDYGAGIRSNKMAKHALVFLIQGVSLKFKQPVAYYFTAGGISSDQLLDSKPMTAAERLQSLLKDVLNALQEANVPVLATICDMGTANVKALQNMGSTTSTPYIIHNNQRIFTIFDVPHLLKSFRNLFRKHNILVPTLTVGSAIKVKLIARWSDIVAAYNEDKKTDLIFRSLHKLKDYYFAPVGQTAMKVKVAAQILSRTVSVYLYNLIQRAFLPPRSLATATFVHEMDELFDSLNGTSRTGPDGKPYRCAVSDESGHITFWEDAYNRVNSWRFIRKTKDLTALNPWKPPSQEGWLRSLKAFIEIWSRLKTLGYDS